MDDTSSVGCSACPFRGMNDAGTVACQRGHVSKVAAGQVVHCSDVRTPMVYVLRTGSAKVHRSGVDGQTHILQLLAPGDVWNLESLQDDVNPSALTALESTTVCAVPVGVVRRLLVEDSTVPIRLVVKLQDLLRQCHEQEICLGTYRAAGKVTCLLLHQAGRTPDGRVAWRRRLTYAELGELLGTSGETVCRVLADLRLRGAIDWDVDWIYLLNPQLLQAYSQASSKSAAPSTTLSSRSSSRRTGAGRAGQKRLR